MNGALQQVEWESPLVEPVPDPALQSYARRRWGVPNPMISYFAPVPWMARAVIDLHPEYGLLMHLDQTVADLVVLVVPFLLRCRAGVTVGAGNALGTHRAHGTGPDAGRSAAADDGGGRLRAKPVALGSRGSAGGP